MSSCKWITYPQDKSLALELGEKLGLSPLVSQILINRGLKTSREALEFLESPWEDTPSPFLMRGMKKAVERIKTALEKGEGIVIYGDYDVDGQTATALLVSVLRQMAKSPDLISYYLPDRLEEGYGLHLDAIKKLAGTASLLITVDCGISSVAEVTSALQLGLEIIITDHHQPGPVLPPALAVLNPRQSNCPYPDKNLAGVGVVYKLVQGLGLNKKDLFGYLDLVALGTVADLVPLRGENRIWVKHGLKQMVKTKHPGLKALLEVSKVDQPSSGHLGFHLGPRLNAAGRLADPGEGVKLLLATAKEEADDLALKLERTNRLRQDLERKILAEAIAVVEKYGLAAEAGIVIWGENWHPGVIGIVASRLVDRYYRPTVVIGLKEGIGTGSARSIEGFDLYSGLASCQELLIKFGGHPMAAGLQISRKNLRLFQKRFLKSCAEKLSSEDFTPKLKIDGEVKLNEITEALVSELGRLEPHGIGNPGPTLYVQGAVQKARTVGQKNRHLQCVLQDATGTAIPAVGFDFGAEQGELKRFSENISIAFVPRFNYWQNQKKVQLQIKAWKRGPRAADYVEKWMMDNYPWKLSPPFFLSRALTKYNKPSKKNREFDWQDLRGSWNKIEILQERASSQERTLILVNSPAEVLELCRMLRILIPGGREFIGFEHELLTAEERTEMESNSFRWLVSSGYGRLGGRWPSVWFWKAPFNDCNFKVWSSFVEEKGKLVLAYGPRDLREQQSFLKSIYPNREGLARIYSRLRSLGPNVKLEAAQAQLEKMGFPAALPFALGVFSETELWRKEGDYIIYQPIPAEKLDLQRTVLYNKGTIMREQSSEYLKHCLERGFFQDGLTREN
ncbi:MAG: single-stranded-DNA-specific exonuclease RecJ [Firmicutes bacterium]|nr:single-stranded-DNA-specific exonuclease RecJ [Bacillota bacterium]